MHKVHKSGADGYVIKPFKAEELLGVVRGYESHRPSGARHWTHDPAKRTLSED